MWAFSVLWFGLFFFLLPMIVVPRFWNQWMDVLFGIGKPGKSGRLKKIHLKFLKKCLKLFE